MNPVALTPGPADAAKRLDHFLQEKLPDFTRSRLQFWIKSGNVSVDGAPAKASHLLRGGERIEVTPADLPPLNATADSA